jgi:hypothetical protein
MMATKPQTDPTITPMLVPPFFSLESELVEGVAVDEVMEELLSAVFEGIEGGSFSEVGFTDDVGEGTGGFELGAATEELGLGATILDAGGDGCGAGEGIVGLDGAEGAGADGVGEAEGSGTEEDVQDLNIPHRNCALISCTNTRAINKTIKLNRVLFKRITVLNE